MMTPRFWKLHYQIFRTDDWLAKLLNIEAELGNEMVGKAEELRDMKSDPVSGQGLIGYRCLLSINVCGNPMSPGQVLVKLKRNDVIVIAGDCAHVVSHYPRPICGPIPLTVFLADKDVVEMLLPIFDADQLQCSLDIAAKIVSHSIRYMEEDSW